MKVFYTPQFRRSFRKFSPSIQQKFEKQIGYLLQDIRYPSLRAKRYDEERRIWQARVDDTIRFYFVVNDDMYILLDIARHLD